MKKESDKEKLMKQRFAVATYAQSNNVARTKSYAERVGIDFNKERVLSDVENIFGSDAVNALREWWNEARLADFDQRLNDLLNLKVDELLAEKSKTSDFAQQPKPTPVVGALVKSGVKTLSSIFYSLTDLLRFDQQYGMATLSPPDPSAAEDMAIKKVSIAVLRPYFLPDGELVIILRWLETTPPSPPALIVRLRGEPIADEQIEWDGWQSDGNQYLMISGIAPESVDLKSAPPDSPLIHLTWDQLENRLALDLLPSAYD